MIFGFDLSLFNKETQTMLVKPQQNDGLTSNIAIFEQLEQWPSTLFHIIA